jgi:hypothetical protein
MTGIEIELVGGPADGRILAIRNDQPPPLYRIPIPSGPLPGFFLHPGEDPDYMPSLTAAEYEPIRENGWPSRTDDGTYRYQYRGTPQPPHPGQRRPTPTVDELAAMTCDPAPTAYPNTRAHLLACRTRHSLRRDARLTRQEQDAVNAVFWDHIRRERPDFPERWPF